MPYYDFLNKKTGEIKSLFFGMNDEKKYIDSDGLEWERQFSIPCAAVDTVIDPFDHKKGINKIDSTRGTIGDMQTFSEEQSRKREEKLGSDPIKTEMYKKYKQTRNKEHPQERAEKVKKLTKDVMIKLNKKLK